MRVIAVDVETNALPPFKGGVLRGVSVYVDDGINEYYPLTHPNSVNVSGVKVAEQLRRWIREADVVLMHNSPFDRIFLALALDVEVPDSKLWDTMTVDWLLNENLNHGLKEIGARLFGEDAKAEKRHLDSIRKGRSVEDVYRELRAEVGRSEPAAVTRERARKISAESKRDWPTFTADDIRDYAKKDTELTYHLYRWQQQYIADHPEYEEALRREFDVVSLAYRMTVVGVRVDRDRAAQALADAEAKRDAVTERIAVENPGSAKQIGEWLFEREKLPVKRRTDSGAPSTDEKALDPLRWHDGVAALLEWRHWNKEITSFYLPLLDKADDNDRVHPSWNANRTVTGRWSCSEPNLQQTPREGDVRKCLIAADGYRLWGADLPNAELRVIAILSGEQSWLDTLAAGADMHQNTADRMVVTRHVGKQANFSLPYGTRGRKFAEILAAGTGQPPDNGAGYRYVEQFWKSVPRIKRLFEGLSEMWQRRGRMPIRPWPGRFRHIETEWGREPGYKILNSVVQGGIGEAVKDWCLLIDQRVTELGGRLVAQVHDAAYVEVPDTVDQDTVARMFQDTWDQVNPWPELPWPIETKEGM